MKKESKRPIRRPLSELNVIDDFLFTEMMNNPEHNIEFSELLLSTLLGRKVLVREVHSQKVMGGPDTDRHGIRMDAFIEPQPNGEERAVIYDLEMETREVDKKSLPGRSRYYSAMLDSHILESGKDYDTIPKLMTIFVLSYDPFDMGCMIYEVYGLNSQKS